MYIYKSPSLVPTSVSVITSTGVLNRYLVLRQMNVNQLLFVVSTTLSSSAGAVIQYIYRPTVGSATGQTVLGTITTGLTTAAGQLFYNNIKNVVCAPGGELVINVSTASTSAGAGQGAFCADEDPEAMANIANATLVTA